VQRAFIMADDVVGEHCLPAELSQTRPGSGPFFQVRAGSRVADVERQLILATLEQCGGTKEKAAAMLGISLKTLYNRLREYDSRAETPSGSDSGSSGAIMADSS
jgi:DNA-binding NtrC family response regulator